MEIARLVKLDEEALLLEEENPLLRSLSMSRNMALSVLDEVPHMINHAPLDSPKFILLRRSSSTSSLVRLSKDKNSKKHGGNHDEVERSAYFNSPLEEIVQSHPVSLSLVENPGVIRAMELDGFSLFESNSSLSQITFPSIRGVKKNELLTGIVVSRWDNIVGPQCVYLWTEEMTSLFYPGNLPPHLSGVVKYVTDHTVDHQDVDGNVLSSSTERTTLCIVPDLSLVYISISIRVPSEIETVLEFASSSSMTANDPDQPATSVPHAVAILANLKFLSHFLLLRPLVVGWLDEFASKIGVLLCKNKLQSSMINSWCAELCKTMTALKTCWVQEIPPTNTKNGESFSNQKTGQNLKSNTTLGANYKRSNVHDMDYLPPNPRHVPKSYWGSLLTSHLSTFGSSIVVGYDNFAVNQVIQFLLCFSSNQEGYCSRYTLATLPDTFMKGLFIQGLTQGGIGERSISYNQVTSNKYPLTHIELGSKVKIKQMNPQTHRQSRSSVLMQELRALWTASVFISPPNDPFPQLVKEAAGFVTQVLDDLLLLPPARRYGRLILFRRTVHAKAIILITYLQSIRHMPIKDRTKLTKLIPEVLGFDDHEYIIIQVTAEKLRPGVLRLVYS